MTMLLKKNLDFLMANFAIVNIGRFFTKIAIKSSIFNQNQKNKNVSSLEFNFTQ